MSIRVLQVVTHMNRGGLETMLMNYYRSIDREKVQFDFLTHRPYDGDYGEEIKKMGGKIYHLPILNPFSFSYKRTLRQFFESHPEYRIIHVHQDCLSGVILKVAKDCGIEVRIAHSHSSHQDLDIKYLIKVVCRRSISKYATKLIACGNEAGKWMFCGADFQVLNNAIDTNKYVVSSEKREKVRNTLGIQEDELIIGHVGRWNYPKNHLFLLDIFSCLKESIPNLKLLLVGNDQGDYAEKVKKKIKELELEDSIIVTGVRTDVADLLQAMDVFVFPSNYEGLPVTMIEAQASGLPCLISDKVPIECKVTENVQQIPLSVGAKTWSERIIKVAKETIRCDVSKKIRESGFDIEENAKWLQNYYLKLASR